MTFKVASSGAWAKGSIIAWGGNITTPSPRSATAVGAVGGASLQAATTIYPEATSARRPENEAGLGVRGGVELIVGLVSQKK